MGLRHKGVLCAFTIILISSVKAPRVDAAYHFDSFVGRPPIHEYGSVTKVPSGMTPSLVKILYGLPQTGGIGTIAIVGAYYDASAEKDLADFDTQFNLPACTIKNGCFEQHLLASKAGQNSGWAMETSLDIEWAHAIAPQAKILLVEAPTPSGVNFIKAIDYARSRKDVVAVSMSWGGAEFSDETSLDAHFTSDHGIQFFASSGDNGTGASWPAASPYVIGVGGTTLLTTTSGMFEKEVAWQGSGGGVSAYETAPAFQSIVSTQRTNGMRAIPDVAYDADPATGFPIVHAGLWHRVGGTSAGAPQWAALSTLGRGVSLMHLYADKASQHSALYFRDITSGINGDCGYDCTAHLKYDMVTGLGSPQTINF